MQKNILLVLMTILLVGFSGCTTFNRDEAVESIKDIIYSENTRLPRAGIEIVASFQDTIMLDSLCRLEEMNFSTTLASDSLNFVFNQTSRNDSLITIGDSSIVTILRSYSGIMESKIRSIDNDSSRTIEKSFSSQRSQYALFTDNDGWNLSGYSFAEERSDTNTTQIFSLSIKTSTLDTTLYSTASISSLEDLPVILKGTPLSLVLRTAADTSELVCLVLSDNVVRFRPKPGESKHWTAETTMGPGSLVIAIFSKNALLDETYPADFDFWVVPYSE